jgi:transcriptional antiterminator Rof (Rho-off)
VYHPPRNIDPDMVLELILTEAKDYSRKASDTEDRDRQVEYLRIAVALQDVATKIFTTNDPEATSEDYNEYYSSVVPY